MAESRRLTGIVLAAGAGVRMGMPKGLLVTQYGQSWAARAATVLHVAGCDPVLVTVGASGAEVAATLPGDATAVPVSDWTEGLGASLRTALGTVDRDASDAVVIIPVDVPDLAAVDVATVVAAIAGPLRTGLARAVHDGQPGHPVVIGADHLDRAIAECAGEHGPRALLREAVCVEIGPRPDIDTPCPDIKAP